MALEQAIRQPFGITVFGSATLYIEPDFASLTFAVTRVAQHPKEAFRAARDGAQSVMAFLAQAQAADVGSSRVTLTQTFRYANGEQHFVGYTAKVAFHVLLRNLDRLEDVLSGVVDAGANQINSIELQTSQLKEQRAEARSRAVMAAREKAENYCKAAGITLGPIIHIEDVNPQLLQGQEGHVVRETQPDDAGPLRAFDPGSIMVGGAVLAAFEIGH